MERNLFFVRIIVAALAYTGISYWLNAIRADAELWFVWLLIIVQFTLYFSIFILSYWRAMLFGLNKNLNLIIFVALAILGRINNWELVVIPLTVIGMLIISARVKDDSGRGKAILPEMKGN